MEDSEEASIRLAALCKKLGGLWNQKQIVALDDEISAAKIRECKLSLIGKLYQDPKVNIQAFQTTMRKAWKTENVDISLIASGIFEIKFWNEADRKRVFEQGPWSFANNLLLLKEWMPDTPPTCYNFTSCAFWVQICGLPTEWTTENVVSKVASEIGKVSAVRIESRGYSTYKVAKAKVELDIATPLIQGSIFSNKKKNLWLDFRYERLPYYCYACGKIGHYAQHCQEKPCDVENEDCMKKLAYGSWLKVEANEYSPYWKLFYGTKIEELMEEEEIPETPTGEGQTVVYKVQEEDSRKKKGKSVFIEEATEETTDRMVLESGLKLHDGLDSSWREGDLNTLGIENRKRGKSLKPLLNKRKKRFSPYEMHMVNKEDLDETGLLETQIHTVAEVYNRALVACPNKPPGYK